ncbi:MAG: hypothetical protein AAF467_20895 [Actinomycetota bacterium]
MTKRIISGIVLLIALGALGIILAGALATGEQLIVRFLTAIIVAAVGLYVISDLRLQADNEAAAAGTRATVASPRVTTSEQPPPNSTAAFMATVTRRRGGEPAPANADTPATVPPSAPTVRTERAMAAATESAATPAAGAEQPPIRHEQQEPLTAGAEPSERDDMADEPTIQLTGTAAIADEATIDLPEHDGAVESHPVGDADTAQTAATVDDADTDADVLAAANLTAEPADAADAVDEIDLRDSAEAAERARAATMQAMPLRERSRRPNKVVSAYSAEFGEAELRPFTSNQSASTGDENEIDNLVAIFTKETERELASSAIAADDRAGVLSAVGVGATTATDSVTATEAAPNADIGTGGDFLRPAPKTRGRSGSSESTSASARRSSVSPSKAAATKPSPKRTGAGGSSTGTGSTPPAPSGPAESSEAGDSPDTTKPVDKGEDLPTAAADDTPAGVATDEADATAEAEIAAAATAAPDEQLDADAATNADDVAAEDIDDIDDLITTAASGRKTSAAPETSAEATADPTVTETTMNDGPSADDPDVTAEVPAAPVNGDGSPHFPPSRVSPVEAAAYGFDPIAPIIDLRSREGRSHSEIDAAIEQGEVEVIESLIAQGVLSTEGPVSDRDVRTMVYVAFTSSELRKILTAGGTADGDLSQLDLGDVEVFHDLPQSQQKSLGPGLDTSADIPDDYSPDSHAL